MKINYYLYYQSHFYVKFKSKQESLKNMSLLPYPFDSSYTLDSFLTSKLLDELTNHLDLISLDPCSEDEFQVHIDVQHFKPEEISVKITESNKVVVEGSHTERLDEHGSVSRRFSRMFLVPQEYDVNRLESKLSCDGVLSLTAPKRRSSEEQRQITYVEIPVLRQGVDGRGRERGDKKGGF